MGLALDTRLAAQILREEAQRAETEEAPPDWIEKIDQLSKICEHYDIRTHIAFLGTAILAKAVNRHVDPFAIKAAARRPGAYSARGLCHRALVPNAAELGIDIGTRGREPINNQPYFRSAEVSSAMPIKESTRPALDALMSVLSNLSRVETEEKARNVLRAFIKVRRGYRPSYPDPAFGALGLSFSEFCDRVTIFVSERSEGGRRAQAVAAGLLIACFGSGRVVTKGLNDPDRDLRGDVGVLSQSALVRWDIVVEVRDKPVTTSDVRIFAEKALEAGAPRAAMIAVAHGQTGSLSIAGEVSLASGLGLLLHYISSWDSFISQILFWNAASIADLLEGANAAIRKQLIALGASVETVARWDELMGSSGSSEP